MAHDPSIPVQANKTLDKKAVPLSCSIGDHATSFSFDALIAAYLEEHTTNIPSHVLDVDRMDDIIANVGASLSSERGPEANQKYVAHEHERYKGVSVVGFKQGCRFAGLFKWSIPHVQLQMEGTRAMAVASISDATWL